jgi:hypothetical protein
VEIGAGSIAVWLRFVGAERPRFEHVEIRGPVTRDGEASDRAVFDGDGPVRVGAILDALIDRLGDVSVDLEAIPLTDVVLAFPAGIELVMPARAVLRINGATDGPAGALCLCRPLEVAIGAPGLQITHRQLRWLASPVTVAHARLLPDGTVALEGANGRLARIVQGGLDVASDQLTDLVRTAPAFERVRAFLRTP